MAVSQNGWPVDPQLDAITVAGRTALVRAGDVATVLLWWAQQWHARVEPVTTLYGHRSAAQNAATGTPVSDSNHRSATAEDLNGGQHPYEYARLKAGRTWSPTITGAKRDAVHAIVAEAGGVIRWGGDYKSPYRDEMHAEIIAGADRVAALAARIRSTPLVGGSTVRPQITEEDDMAISPQDVERITKRWFGTSENALSEDELIFQADAANAAGMTFAQIRDSIGSSPCDARVVREAYRTMLGGRAPSEADIKLRASLSIRAAWDSIAASAAAGAK